MQQEKVMGPFWKKLKYFFTVPDTFDPDDLRLRRVCSGVLTVIGFVSLASAVFSMIGIESLYDLSVIWPTTSYFQLFLLSIIAFFLALGLFFLNRWKRTPKYLVGLLLVGIIIVLILYSDPPEDLLGRSQLVWVWPILLAAIVLPPWSVFPVDGLLTILIILITPAPVIVEFDYWLPLVLFVIAFFAWLGMSVAERAIQDARNEAEKNRAILDGVADGVVVFRTDNTIALANPAAGELLDGEMHKIVSAANTAEISGRILSLRWSDVPGVGRIAIVRDITRQIEVERAKDALLSVVSHEMRTPLSVILGFAELLKVRPTLEMAERIRVNALRMIRTIDNMLDLAQLQAGALKMYPEKFSPRLLAEEVSKSLRAPAAEKQVELKVMVLETLPKEITGDFHRYRQILANLVDNAIKFTQAGGCVDVLLAPHADAGKWQMVVRDTGIGIPHERLPDIFLPFRRASDYTKRSYQGTGLGLSIAKSMVQLAHGDIHVESMVGHGSTFIVSLPINGGAE